MAKAANSANDRESRNMMSSGQKLKQQFQYRYVTDSEGGNAEVMSYRNVSNISTDGVRQHRKYQ